MAKAKEKARLRQQNILQYMREEVRVRGYAPTVREICNALGIKSTSTVHKDLEILVEEGSIRKDPSKPRALVLADREIPKPAPAEVVQERIDTVDIPIAQHYAGYFRILA